MPVGFPLPAALPIKKMAVGPCAPPIIPMDAVAEGRNALSGGSMVWWTLLLNLKRSPSGNAGSMLHNEVNFCFSLPPQYPIIPYP